MYWPLDPADLREAADLGLHVPPDRLRPGAELRQEGADDAVLLLDEREQEVLGLDLLVTLTVRQRLGGLDRLLRLDGQLVEAKRRHGVYCLLGHPGPYRRGPAGSSCGIHAEV